MSKLEQRFHQLRKVVLGLSGAHEEVLAFVPSERARFESLGWAILITSGVAAVSMWFALASAVGINAILAVPFALAWGLVIMGIDRWLITSMPIDGPRKFAMAAPRLALALLLGTLISTPLVLRIFQSEINAQIAKMQQQSYNSFLIQQQASDVAKQVGTYSSELQYLNNVIATHGAATANTASDPQLIAYNNQLTTLNNELTHWTNLKSQYYNQYICQLYGGPACPKKGLGPAARASQANYNSASQQVDTIKGQINQVQGQIQQRDAQLNSHSKADEQARYQQALTQQPIVKNEYDTALQRQNQLQASFFATNQAAHGILVRLEALSQLSSGNLTVSAARFLLFLLFLVIECLPVTVKLLQRPGLYEEALLQAQRAERRDVGKFYSFRSRLTGPSGTTVLRPALGIEPDQRIGAIWTPTRALPGSVVSEDDLPTQALDDPTPPWAANGGDQGPAGGGPGGRPGSRPESRPDGGRPEQSWYGDDRWRNHWQQRPADDDEPPLGATRHDDAYGAAGTAGTAGQMPGTAGQMPGTAGQRPGPADMATRPDYGQAYGDAAYGYDSERVTAYDNEGLYDSDGYRARGWDDRVSPTPDGEEAAPAVSPRRGGTPLSWDEDE